MINVLPQSEKDSLTRDYWMRFGSVVFFLATLSAIFSIILLVPSYFFSVSKLSLAGERLFVWNESHKMINADTTNSVIDDTNQKLGLLNTASVRQITKEALVPILSLRPSGVTFSQILYGNQGEGFKKIEIHGNASDRTTLRAFQSLLDKSGRFSSVDIPLSSFLGKKDIQFTASLTLK